MRHRKNDLKIKSTKDQCNNLNKNPKNNFIPSYEFYNKNLKKLNITTTNLEEIYQKKCFYPLERFHATIEVVDKDDHLARTRTEQLALPKPRKLEILQQREAFKNFDEIRKLQTYRLYKKSLLSVYSRFMKSKQSKESPKPKPTDKNLEEKRNEHLKKLAKPKKDFSELSSSSKGSKPSKTPNPKRLKKLSRPVLKNSETERKSWKLTKALKNFKPTKRLCELSEPRKYALEYKNFYEIDPLALTYRATTRIKELSKPLKIYVKTVDKKEENWFKVSKRALKAKSTQRINELADPRQYTEIHIRANPYAISKKALKSKASKRIKLLAQPKVFKD